MTKHFFKESKQGFGVINVPVEAYYDLARVMMMTVEVVDEETKQKIG